MAKAKKFDKQLQNSDGLLTYEDITDGVSHLCCLGYLLSHQNQVYDASFGLIEGLTAEQADAHNKMLSKLELTGLDANCDVGMGGMFYCRKEPSTGRYRISTFVGDVVSDQVLVRGKTIMFVRGDKKYQGRMRKEQDLFSFKRIE